MFSVRVGIAGSASTRPARTERNSTRRPGGGGIPGSKGIRGRLSQARVRAPTAEAVNGRDRVAKEDVNLHCFPFGLSLQGDYTLRVRLTGNKICALRSWAHQDAGGSALVGPNLNLAYPFY